MYMLSFSILKHIHTFAHENKNIEQELLLFY